MKKNYVAKQVEVKQALLDIGVTCGKQQIIDYLTIALRDPEIMGKDIFGRKRIEKIIVKIMMLDKQFSKAYTLDKEADYLQEKLDGLLRDLYGDEIIPFSERQPYVKQLGYKKGRKDWK